MQQPKRGDYQYHYIAGLQQENASLKRRLESMEDGSGMNALRESFASQTRGLEQRLHAEQRAHRRDNARHEREMAAQRRALLEANEDTARYADDQIARARRSEKAAWEQAARSETAWLSEYEQRIRLQKENETLKERIADLEGQMARQNRLLNQNHENSSVPSSQEGVRKRRIHSSRTPSERKPGAQPGHEPRKRPHLEPTESAIFVSGPPEIAESSGWEQIGVRRKLQAEIHLTLRVTPYDFAIYRNVHTGKIFRVPIPEELHDDLNYGPGLKAALFLAHTEFNMPARNVAELFREVSGGRVSVSHGFIAGLTRQFAQKSEAERAQIAANLLRGLYMHVDTTTAQCEGERHHVTTNVNESSVLLSATKHKGREAAEKLPYAAGFTGCGVHDCEAVFFNYAGSHQLCHAHLLRELKDVMENEPDRTWARKMHQLLQEIAHERKGWPKEGAPPQCKRNIRRKYTRCVNIGLAEYEEKDASKYYPHGKNLLKRMQNERDAILHFLDHPEIPATNNAAERALRPVKRKQSSGMCRRSAESLDDYCKAKSVLSTERKQGRSCYEKCVEVMNRPRDFRSSTEQEAPVLH